MQLGIEDSPTYKQVFIDFDFTSIGLLGSDAQFVLLLDTPSVRKLIFDNAGAISLSPIDGIAIEKQIGTFSNQETFHLHVDIDLSSNIWSIFKNDILLDSANFNADSYIQDMRFSYGLRSSSDLPDDSGAAIDNLVVAAIPVPEPTCLTLVILSGFSILLLRKFIKLSYQDAAANP
jgi:hypothetical protein